MTGNPLPLAVIGRRGGETARLLREMTGYPVEELTPCGAVLKGDECRYRAVVVENYDCADRRLFSGCAAARWALACRTDVTVAAIDDEEGRRLAADGLKVFSYSDGLPQADLSAKNVRLRGDELEFVALSGDELQRIRIPAGRTSGLYECLAALAAALALGMPLEQAAARLARAK